MRRLSNRWVFIRPYDTMQPIADSPITTGLATKRAALLCIRSLKYTHTHTHYSLMKLWLPPSLLSVQLGNITKNALDINMINILLQDNCKTCFKLRMICLDSPVIPMLGFAADDNLVVSLTTVTHHYCWNSIHNILRVICRGSYTGKDLIGDRVIVG